MQQPEINTFKPRLRVLNRGQVFAIPTAVWAELYIALNFAGSVRQRMLCALLLAFLYASR